MMGLDTNVVVRYLVQDDPKQAQIANRFIEKAVAHGEILWICQVTLCEVVWVLESCYNIDKGQLINVVKQLLRTQQIQIEKADVVWQALHDFSHHRGADFSDCLIGRQNASHECAFTYTFDKNAAKKLNTMFRLIS